MYCPSESYTTPSGNYNKDEFLRAKRRGNYALSDNALSVQRNYCIGGSIYKVNSIFDVSKKTAVDGVRHLIDADLERSDLIQLTFPKISSIVAVAETENAPLHMQSA